VGEWLERWLAEYVVPTRSQKTRERYEGVIKKHIAPVLGRLELSKVTPVDIRSFEANLSAQGMAPGGVQLVHSVISSAYKYALKDDSGIAWRNPAKAVTPPKIVRKEVEPPEIARVREVLELAASEGHPLFPCLHLIAYTGIRRGEAWGLRQQDLNLETGIISIVQTVSRSLQQGIIIQPTKTNSSRRSVDLDDDTIDVLRAHLGRQLLSRMELEGVYEDQGLLFPDPPGKPLNPMVLTRTFQSYAKKLGIKEAKVHNLRHFHATLLMKNGGNPKTVQERLGHSSIAVTMDIYSHVVPGIQELAAMNFEEGLKRNKTANQEEPARQ